MERDRPALQRWRMDGQPDLLAELIEGWPPAQAQPGAGYNADDLATLHIVDALALPTAQDRGAVAVVADLDGALAALPLVEQHSGWMVATAGDGLAQALVAACHASSPMAPSAGPFLLEVSDGLPTAAADERSLGTDQSNTSVALGTVLIVKWRTAFEADGRRAVTLRRHIASGGFDGSPPLLGVLRWQGEAGAVVLADIDAYLRGAADGWDVFIAALIADLEDRDPGAVRTSLGLCQDLGVLTAQLHVAMATPSALLPQPRDEAGPRRISAWRREGHAALAAAVAIDAHDQATFAQWFTTLERQIDHLAAIETTHIQPIHADLHLGQVVAWDDGLAIIDFDGPPGRFPSAELELGSPARDVAQLLVSLEQLAVVVDRRTDQRHRRAAQAWAHRAGEAFLEAYRRTLATLGAEDLHDERLLAPFAAEQSCRELIYADAVLPRWRYAPMEALAWRYPEAER